MVEAPEVVPRVSIVPKIWDFVIGSKKRWNILCGGAGSGKSVGVSQHLLFNHFYRDEGITILVVRKTLPSLRTSCIQLMLEQMRELNLPHEHNKSSLIVWNGNNRILFRSLDDVEKLKSIVGINFVWVEEATEVGEKDIRQLDIRMRGKVPGVTNQLYLTFNPIDANSWLKPWTEVPADYMGVCHSTFRDNPYLDPVYVQSLERLIDVDPVYHAIYNLGQWATPTNIIYSNWDAVPDTAWPERFDEERYGLDFGFAASEQALMHIRRLGGELYVKQLLYQRRLTTLDLLKEMDKLIDKHKKVKIIADSARPEDIEEIHRNGYNIHPCIKGVGSVQTGINRVKQFRIHILESGSDVIDEIRAYKWATDKNDNILDKPVRLHDHLMDALRYAVADMARTLPAYSQYGTASQMKAADQAATASKLETAQRVIDSLVGADWQTVMETCQGLMRNPTPEVLAGLEKNRNHPDPDVAMRCNEMLDALQSRIKLKVPK